MRPIAATNVKDLHATTIYIEAMIVLNLVFLRTCLKGESYKSLSAQTCSDNEKTPAMPKSSIITLSLSKDLRKPGDQVTGVVNVDVGSIQDKNVELVSVSLIGQIAM